MSDYVPIACAAHERLEYAVLRRQRLRLTTNGADGGTSTSVVLPTDVYTRDGAEWLVFRDEADVESRVRLDQIEAAIPIERQ